MINQSFEESFSSHDEYHVQLPFASRDLEPQEFARERADLTVLNLHVFLSRAIGG